jgi:hypothetical protein
MTGDNYRPQWRMEETPGKHRHAFSRWTYQKLADGTVRVEDPFTEAWGVFTPAGNWLEGDIADAELHMIGWVGGPHVTDLIALEHSPRRRIGGLSSPVRLSV